MILLVPSGKVGFFSPENRVFFPWTENDRNDLSQEIHGNVIFSI